MISDNEYEYDYSSDETNWEDGDYEESMEISSSYQKQRETICFMNACDLFPEMESRLKDAAEALNISEFSAAALLRDYKWSNQLLLEAYYDDPCKVKEKSGIYYRCSTATSPTAVSNEKIENCSICYDFMDSKSKLAMPCGHTFCIDCWNAYFTNSVLEDGPACILATCPDSNCKEVITEEEIKICAPELLDKYRTYQLRNFVESSTMMRWCPGKGCERIAFTHRILDENETASCDLCRTSFCLSCGEEPHDPCSCKILASWTEKCNNDSETANWMTVNTKNCPKCSTRIQKDGGCMFVTCSKCKHGFCWICMGNHHVWECNKFKEDNTADKTKAKNDLERYMHYYKRFAAHAESQEFAAKQVKKFESMESKMMEDNPAEEFVWRDLNFLMEAGEELVRCRQVLKYTYAFAYYHFLNSDIENEKLQFEHHQGMLERLTEELAHSTEQPLKEVDECNVKNQTRVIGRFVSNLLDFINR